VSSIFLRNWALVVPSLCSRFHIFNRPILEEHDSQVERGPHMFQSCLHATQNGLLPTSREMHLSFESLAVINAPSLHAYMMDIHHDTFLRSIFEDDSISSTSKARIHSYLSNRVGLWLVARLFIYLFHNTHSTFISTLHFCLGLI
jgi:hypothetical protein